MLLHDPLIKNFSTRITELEQLVETNYTLWNESDKVLQTRITTLQRNLGMKDDALASFSEFYDWCLSLLGEDPNDYSEETECNMKTKLTAARIAELIKDGPYAST